MPLNGQCFLLQISDDQALAPESLNRTPTVTPKNITLRRDSIFFMQRVLQSLKVNPIAFDSIGVRSMATYVETDDLKILIDPAVALGPKRYGLPPHPLEIKRMHETWDDVLKYAAISDVLIVTHYHYDHHNPDEPDLYNDKILYLKDPKRNINKSQSGRASYFLGKLESMPREQKVADGKEFHHGSTTIKFSPAVYHGTGSRLGYVIETSISCGDEKVVHTSDVEGPSIADQAAFIIQENPDLLILDGPMTYMLGYRYSQESLRSAISNINSIIRNTSVRSIIADHHLLRDLKYRERLAGVYEYALENERTVLNAAEYAGRETDMLEARRKELYGL